MALRRTQVHAEAEQQWAASGAMWLTGRADGPPLLAPPDVATAMAAWAAGVAELSGVELDGPALLGERAALAGLSRQGATSCGGATRLVRAVDGWLAVSLARPDDVAALPAWLEDAADPDAVPAAVAGRALAELVDRAALLGLPVAALGEAAGVPAVRVARSAAGCPPARSFDELLVVDLSSLWAGPLCAQILTQCGARVVKVESQTRPDGARSGPATFFDLLHAGQESVVLDFTGERGRAELARLVAAADIVIEASRPRALRQLGVDPDALLSEERPRIWVSMTGFGRRGAAANRAAFGDDAAVAGGLVVWDGAGPCFCADAVADPAAGLLAGYTVLRALRSGARWRIDVALSGVAAELAGPYSRQPFEGRGSDHVPARPRARVPRGRAPSFGRHTEAVLREIPR